MATKAQLAQYCADHFPQSHWSLGLFTPEWLKLAFWAGVIALAYTVGRVGLSQAWTDIKNVYAWIRNKFSGTKTTATTTPTAS